MSLRKPTVELIGAYLSDEEVAERDLCVGVTLGSHEMLTVYKTRAQCIAAWGCETHGLGHTPGPEVLAVEHSLEDWQWVEERW